MIVRIGDVNLDGPEYEPIDNSEAIRLLRRGERDRVVCSFVRMVRQISREWEVRAGLEAGSLLSVAFFGAMHGIKRWRADGGEQLHNWVARHVRYSLMKDARKCCRGLPLPDDYDVGECDSHVAFEVRDALESVPRRFRTTVERQFGIGRPRETITEQALRDGRRREDVRMESVVGREILRRLLT